MLEVGIPEDDGSGLTLETCLTEYFNNRIEVKRYLQQRRATIGSIRSRASFDSTKAYASHIEAIECDDSLPSPPTSPIPSSVKSPKRSWLPRAQASTIIQEYVSEKIDALDAPDSESQQNGRRRAGSVRNEVMMPAWQFFSLIPWYTDAKPSNDQQVAAHFHTARPMLGIPPIITSIIDRMIVLTLGDRHLSETVLVPTKRTGDTERHAHRYSL